MNKHQCFSDYVIGVKDRGSSLDFDGSVTRLLDSSVTMDDSSNVLGRNSVVIVDVGRRAGETI